MSEDDTVGPDAPVADPPEEVFSVLGDETRLRILLELADRSEPEQTGDPVPFSELRRAVGVDDAGRFSYHLDQLREGFVTKDEEGYSPTVAGLHVASSIHAGRYGAEAPELSAEVDVDCPVCDAQSELRHEDGFLQLECVDGHGFFSYPVPAGAAVDRTAEELLAVTADRLSVNLELARNGVCPRCWATTTVEIRPPDGTYEEVGEDCPRGVVECDRCWLAYQVPAPLLAVRSPPVVAFYERHGIEPQAAIQGQFELLDNADIALRSTDPVRVEVAVAIQGDELVLELDGDCEILSCERR